MTGRTRISRRQLLSVSAGAMATAVTGRARACEALQIGVIGCGRQGMTLLENLVRRPSVQVAAVCDVFAPHRQRAQALSRARAYHSWEDLVTRPDVDAVVIATPDHWHAAMAVGAMKAGKAVYCETPMARTALEARQVRDCAVAMGPVFQVGAARTSQEQWRAARDVIGSKKIGPVLWSQGRYGAGPGQRITPHRSMVSIPSITPQNLDWDRFIGPAPPRTFSPERFTHWRDYWDYSAGVAAEHHYGELAPLLFAIGCDTPERVSAAGGVYAEDGRETPDTMIMTAQYSPGTTVVVAGSTAPEADTGYRAPDLPAVARGREATVYFEDSRIRVVPECNCSGRAVMMRTRATSDHVGNWLDAIRGDATCNCDADLGYRTMVAVDMAVEAYRQRRTVRATHVSLVSARMDSLGKASHNC